MREEKRAETGDDIEDTWEEEACERKPGWIKRIQRQRKPWGSPGWLGNMQI